MTKRRQEKEQLMDESAHREKSFYVTCWGLAGQMLGPSNLRLDTRVGGGGNH